jgi:hypothetical protein
MLLAATILAGAEMIDRLAASVGRTAITESALLLEIRLTALWNDEEPRFDSENKRKTLNRLIEQALIRNEMEVTRYSLPESEAGAVLENWKKLRFPDDAAYRKALEKYHVREQDLLQGFWRQLATVRFVDLRFRPGAHVQETEIREHYDKRLIPGWENKNSKPPSFEDAHAQIVELLTAERVDQMLDTWLKEARGRTRIDAREEVLK